MLLFLFSEKNSGTDGTDNLLQPLYLQQWRRTGGVEQKVLGSGTGTGSGTGSDGNHGQAPGSGLGRL